MRSKQLIGTFGLMAFPTTREGQISPAVGGGLRASRAKRDPQMPDESAAKKDVRSQVSG